MAVTYLGWSVINSLNVKARDWEHGVLTAIKGYKRWPGKDEQKFLSDSLNLRGPQDSWLEMWDISLRMTCGGQRYRPENCSERSRNIGHEYVYVRTHTHARTHKNVQGLPVSSENAWLTAGGRTQENSGTDTQERSFRESRVFGGRRLKQSGMKPLTWGKPHNLWGWGRRWGCFHRAWRYGLTLGFLKLRLPKFWRLEMEFAFSSFPFLWQMVVSTCFCSTQV